MHVKLAHALTCAEDLDKNLMLSMQYVCSQEGIKIPWDSVAAVMADNVTGGAIVQHLAKLRARMVEQGIAVPPPLKRGGTTAPSKIYSRKRKSAAEPIPDAVRKTPRSKNKVQSGNDEEDSPSDEAAEPDDPDAEWGVQKSRVQRKSVVAKKIKREENDEDEEDMGETRGSVSPLVRKGTKNSKSSIQKSETDSPARSSPALVTRRRSVVKDYAALNGGAETDSEDEDGKYNDTGESYLREDEGLIDNQGAKDRHRSEYESSSDAEMPSNVVRHSVPSGRFRFANIFEDAGIEIETKRISQSPMTIQTSVNAHPFGLQHADIGFQGFASPSPFGSIGSAFPNSYVMHSPTGLPTGLPTGHFSHGMARFAVADHGLRLDTSGGYGQPLYHHRGLTVSPHNQAFEIVNPPFSNSNMHPSASTSFSSASQGSTPALAPGARGSMDSFGSQPGIMNGGSTFTGSFDMANDNLDFGMNTDMYHGEWINNVPRLWLTMIGFHQ